MPEQPDLAEIFGVVSRRATKSPGAIDRTRPAHADIDFPALMEPVAKRLLGEPNKALSSPTELRYGTRGSLAIDLRKGTFFDHEVGQGGGTLDLVTRETGLHEQARVEWMHEQGFAFEREHTGGNGARPVVHREQRKLGPIVATYDYVDEAGALLFQVARFDHPKDFRQRKPDPQGRDGWTWSVKGVRQVPYRLPELTEAIANEHVVCIVEGEKDADALRRIGVPATTNPAGAGNWKPVLNEHFRGADVVVIGDNDPQKLSDKTGEPMWHPDGRPILSGQDHAQEVARQLTGIAARVRVVDLATVWPECPLKGDISDWLAAGGTVERLNELIEHLPAADERAPQSSSKIRKPTVGPDYSSDESGPSKAPPRIEPISRFRDPSIIPARQWLYGRHYLKGAVGVTIADGGVGKTNLEIAEGIALASGRNILGVPVPAPQRVLYFNMEETHDEIERRVHAVCQHHGIDPFSELTDRFFMVSGFDLPNSLRLASMVRGSVVFNEAAFDQIAEVITRVAANVVCLDPWISFHQVPENDNTAMENVVGRVAELSFRAAVSIDIAHHIRKPHAGSNADISVADARGAGALINKGRTARTLAAMTAAQAQAANKVAERTKYLRTDDGKSNYAARDAAATWYQIIPVLIGNGDSVAALAPWQFPNAFDRVTPAHLQEVRDILRADKHYRADPRSDDWIGRLIADVAGFDIETDGGAIKQVIERWIAEKMLFRVRRKDETRRKRVFIDSAPPPPDDDEQREMEV